MEIEKIKTAIELFETLKAEKYSMFFISDSGNQAFYNDAISGLKNLLNYTEIINNK